MSKFVKDMPKKGDPVSKPGLVRGLTRMAVALENLSVHNGHIDWGPWGLSPKIVLDAAAAAGDTLPSTSGKSRYMVLSLDSDLNADWDDPRIRIES